MSSLVSDGIFREVCPGCYVRQCIATEAYVCKRSEDGASHVFYSCKVSLNEVNLSYETLKTKIRHCFIYLRHLVPSIACKTFLAPDGKYHLSYSVPRTTEDVLAWTDEVVFVSNEGTSFVENHKRIAPERWWRASEQRHVYELHVAPNLEESRSSWTFTLSVHHCSADGRISWMLFDHFFRYLSDELNGIALPLAHLVWGEETKRLSPASPVVWNLVATGEPYPELNTNNSTPTLVGGAALDDKSAEKVVPWTYRVSELDTSPSQVNYEALLKLTRDETIMFHGACKAHGHTVTQVITALIHLADVEAVLRIAAQNDSTSDLMEEAIYAFEKSTHFVTLLNSVNIRPSMPDGFATFGPTSCVPLLAAYTVPLSYPFSPFRKLLSLVSITERLQRNWKICRNANSAVFWDELVAGAADAWKAQDKSVETYKKRSALTHVAVVNDAIASSTIETNPAPSISSYGDFTRLGLLESFRPLPSSSSLSAAQRIQSQSQKVTVEDVYSSMRFLMAGVLAVTFQYNSEFRVKMTKGAKYATQHEMEMRKRVLREWFEAFSLV